MSQLCCPLCLHTLPIQRKLMMLLSPTQRKLAYLWLAGVPYKEIADATGKTEHCISVHFEHIRLKIGAINNHELTLLLYGLKKFVEWS